MILDKISNYKNFANMTLNEKAFRQFGKVFNHLATVGTNLPIGKVIIEGEDIYAMVMEYDTTVADSAIIETHEKYIDIQMILSGRETMQYFPIGTLPILHDYDPKIDATYFSRVDTLPCTKEARDSGISLDTCCTNIKMDPSLFAIFFPWDIHTGKIMYNTKAELVKKIVYKVSVNSLK